MFRWRSGALAVALFAAYWLLAIGQGPGLADESWFLQVVRRVQEGERLYGDVFFGATPLSVWITSGCVRVFGPELIVVKAVTAAALTASSLLCLGLARRLGVSASGRALLAVALLLAEFEPGTPPYAPLATALALGSFCALERERPRFWLAGLLAGLTFATKQNVGLLVLAAAAGAAAWRERAWRPAMVALGAFAGVVAAMLVPLYLQGSLSAAADYGFFGKGDYLRYGGSLAAIDAEEWLRLLPTHPGYSLRRAFLGLVALTSPLVVATLAWRRRVVPSLMAAAAALACLPRLDAPHVAYVAPVLLLASAVALPTANRWVPSALAAVATLGLAEGALTVFHAWHGGRPLPFPHFAGLRVQPPVAASLARDARDLLACAGGADPFVISKEAGAFYLATALRNPTPFDYPFVTAFGSHGRADVRAAFASRRVLVVCADPRSQGHPLYARELESAAAIDFGPPERRGRWLVYRASGAQRTSPAS